jgi:hypothetical protein
MNPLINLVKPKIKSLGLGEGKLISDCYNPESFGNADAIFEFEFLRLHFIRERGQDFIEFGTVDDPGCFFLFDDVFVGMGWESIGNVLKRKKPIQLDKALGLIQAKKKELKEAFSSERYDLTKIKIKSAEKLREKNFLLYLSEEET